MILIVSSYRTIPCIEAIQLSNYSGVNQYILRNGETFIQNEITEECVANDIA
jgi:hypothetical protein